MSVLYVDTSALLKRVVLEAESSAVRTLLRRADASGDLLTASSLVWLEMWRALRRVGLRNVQPTVRRALAGIAEFPLAESTLLHARRVGGPELRSLDAIHLASALDVGADSLLTYDVRLADAATANGLHVLAPT